MDWTTFGARTMETQKGKIEIRFSPNTFCAGIGLTFNMDNLEALTFFQWQRQPFKMLKLSSICTYVHLFITYCGENRISNFPFCVSNILLFFILFYIYSNKSLKNLEDASVITYLL
jgi:hypothetical protein